MDKTNDELLAEIEGKMKKMNSDNDTQALEDAMEYFCSQGDIRAGFKHAINMTLGYEDLEEDNQEVKGHLVKLLEILNR